MTDLVNNISCLQRSPYFSGIVTQSGYNQIKCSESTENSLLTMSEKT